MIINPAETPLAQPLYYADAASRVQPGRRPEPLGGEFARGLSQPSVKVEISDRAQEALEAQKQRLTALQQSDAENRTRKTGEAPPTDALRTAGAQEAREQAEVRAEQASRNARAEPPAISLEPKTSVLQEPGSGLREKIDAQKNDRPENAPIKRPESQAEPAPPSTSPAPALANGVLPVDAVNSYKAVENASRTYAA